MYFPGDDGGDLQKLSPYDALTVDPSKDSVLMLGGGGCPRGGAVCHRGGAVIAAS